MVVQLGGGNAIENENRGIADGYANSDVDYRCVTVLTAVMKSLGDKVKADGSESDSCGKTEKKPDDAL